jgi:hypothetical protein
MMSAQMLRILKIRKLKEQKKVKKKKSTLRKLAPELFRTIEQDAINNASQFTGSTLIPLCTHIAHVLLNRSRWGKMSHFKSL